MKGKINNLQICSLIPTTKWALSLIDEPTKLFNKLRYSYKAIPSNCISYGHNLDIPQKSQLLQCTIIVEKIDIIANNITFKHACNIVTCTIKKIGERPTSQHKDINESMYNNNAYSAIRKLKLTYTTIAGRGYHLHAIPLFNRPSNSFLLRILQQVRT